MSDSDRKWDAIFFALLTLFSIHCDKFSALIP